MRCPNLRWHSLDLLRRLQNFRFVWENDNPQYLWLVDIHFYLRVQYLFFDKRKDCCMSEQHLLWHFYLGVKRIPVLKYVAQSNPWLFFFFAGSRDQTLVTCSPVVGVIGRKEGDPYWPVPQSGDSASPNIIKDNCLMKFKKKRVIHARIFILPSRESITKFRWNITSFPYR